MSENLVSARIDKNTLTVKVHGMVTPEHALALGSELFMASAESENLLGLEVFWG